MRLASYFFAIALLGAVVSCSSGSGGDSGPTCTAGQACTPTTADPCKSYATVCDSTHTISSCAAVTNRPDGYSCGGGSVCSSGTCVAACVAGTTCTPPGAPSACQVYATTCNAALTETTCSVTGTHPDGEVCGAGSTCHGGACLAPCGLTCAPSGTPNACAVYTTTCDTGGNATGCAVTSLLPNGSSCGAGNVCSSGTCIAACVPGQACTPAGTANACKVYTATCDANLTHTTCSASADRPAGTACGIGGSCTAGTCFGGVAPTLSPLGGSYVTGQVVTITHPAATAVVYYTTDGSEPDNSPTVTSPNFTGGTHTLTLLASTTVKAFAFADGMRSTTTSADYQITPPTPVPPPPSFGSGFTPGTVQMNGSTSIDGTRLRLTNTGYSEVASAFYVTPMDVRSFTTDFTFQLTPAGTSHLADGITFTLQGAGPFAIGSMGGGLGYGPEPQLGSFTSRIPNSVALKFDTFNDIGEGDNSTGVYTGGASPALPADTFPPGTIDLQSGHVFAVHVVYSGVTFTVTVTDMTAPEPRPTFTKSYTVDIPAEVGGPTAYVGFTASTGGSNSKQEVLTWTYAPGP